MEGFKTAFLGFDKKDVTKFTTALAADFSAKLKEKDKEISRLKAEIKNLIDENNSLKQKVNNIEHKETENGIDE